MVPLALLLATAPAPILLGPPEPIAVAITALDAPVSSALSARLADLAARSLSRHTRLDPFPLPARAVEPCGGDLACLATNARLAHAERFRYLLVLSAAERRGGGLVLAAALVDIDRALAPGAVLESAVQVEPEPTALASEDEAAAMIEREVGERMRAAFESTGSFGRLGALAITVSSAGTRAMLDGVAVAILEAGTTELQGVPPGRHQLVLESPGRPALMREVTVEPGARAGVTLPPPEESRAGLVLGGTGLAAVLAGAVLGGVAIADAARTPELICISPGAACPDERGGVNAPGVAAIGLLVSGTAWSLGGFLWEGDRPWLPALVGLGAGAAAAGVAAALR